MTLHAFLELIVYVQSVFKKSNVNICFLLLLGSNYQYFKNVYQVFNLYKRFWRSVKGWKGTGLNQTCHYTNWKVTKSLGTKQKTLKGFDLHSNNPLKTPGSLSLLAKSLKRTKLTLFSVSFLLTASSIFISLSWCSPSSILHLSFNPFSSSVWILDPS